MSHSEIVALKSVGEEVSIIDHMGFVIDWYLLGPFDAPGKTGYAKSFPPEKSVVIFRDLQDGKLTFVCVHSVIAFFLCSLW